jgi:septal ring-binding cell division protein DamX
MSKIDENLKKLDQDRREAISPTRERFGFLRGQKIGGNMGKSWITLVLIIVAVTTFVVFNYQAGKDAVPLSEIFPDDPGISTDIAYEFAEDETVPAPAKEALPVVQEAAVVPVTPPAPKPVIKTTTSVSKPAAVSTGNYTVQIASFKDKKRAEAALADIQIKVPSAYMAARDLGTKGTWYRIYAGQFAERNQAEVTLNDIKKNFNSSFIISSKSAQ